MTSLEEDKPIPLDDPTPVVEPPPRPERLLSIDALRGFDMFWIIGGDALARALCRWWGTPQAALLGEQFEHVDWEGFRFYDLIFPLFLFLVGVVIPFSLTKYQTGEHPRSLALQRTARRVVLLFLLGLINNGLLKFDFESLRVAGVLQRIAVCYGIAAVVFLFTKTRTQGLIFGGILIGYWAILTFVPAPKRTRRATSTSKPTSPATSTATSCPARSTRVITASATTRGCSRPSPPSPPRCWASSRASGSGPPSVPGSRPSA